MPRKPKTSKRLDNLFKDIEPEENNRGSKSRLKVQKEAPLPTDPKPAPKTDIPASTPTPTVRRQTARLVMPDIVRPVPDGKAASAFATNFQIGEKDWAVMRLVDENKGRTFSSDEQMLIKQVTDQLSLALENARLFQETQRRAQELEIVNQVVASVSQSLDLQAALQSVTDNLVNLLNSENVGIALMNAEKTQLILAAETTFDFKPSTQIGLHIPIQGNPPTEEVIRTRKPVFIQNVESNPQAAPIKELLTERGTQNLLILPLISGDEVIGTVGIAFNDGSRMLSQDELRLLETILTQISSSVQRNRLFERVEESESNLRALFSAMDDVVLVITREGRYDQIAPTNPSLLVQAPQNLLGKTYHEVFPKEVADRFLEKIHEALESSEKVQFEYELNIASQNFWFLANLTKLDENRVFWVARDITESKLAEQAIRRRNEYLGASAEIGRLVTSTLDLNTIFARTVNLIIERFGFYHAAIFIVEETGFNAILKESTGEAGLEMKKRQHSLPLNDKSIVGKVTSEGVSVVVNNTEIDPLHKLNPLLPDTRAEAAIPLRIGSRVIGAIDIQSKTTDAFTEDETSVLQTLADQIAVAIDNARSFELSQQAVMEMREADRLKSQFLANMSHELRTPLNSIIGFSRVILKGIDGPITELMQQDLTAIYNSGQHLLGLINDILDSAKIEAGKMELAFDEVNITDLVNSVMSTMTGLVKDKPIQMKKVIDPNLPTVRADAIRIRQVLINLLSNAAKFTEEGEVRVEVGLRPGSTGKNEIMVSVTDTGHGISEKDQEKLFLPFSQVDASPTRKTGGTGLGLSICQQLINMHGGRIWVESEIFKGSTFYFTLPLFRKDGDLLTDGNKTVLAIDDDSQVIGLYERYLQPQGYHVIPLTDPARALERAKQLKPFAITLDVMMPGIDGWTVLETLKSDPETRNIPVIVCSIIEDLEKGFNLGASDYLVKPILEEDLVNTLDRLNSDGSIREVLVIDDNPDDLRLIGKILNEDGRYKAVLAEGGKNGWNILSTGNPPHAVILDLFMPEMNGFQVLEKMHADKNLQDIPVIVLSGLDISAETRKQLDEYGQRLLTKGSFNEKELLNSIQRALEKLKTRNHPGD
ncbi:MAG TPA: GAF domain-containing protein [Anaerolineales bacterium]|nr:GAF domain-containing protein [Anaerolineales bacterium]